MAFSGIVGKGNNTIKPPSHHPSSRKPPGSRKTAFLGHATIAIGTKKAS